MRCSGFVFIAVLCSLALMSLLLITTLQHVLLLQQSINAVMSEQQLMRNMESLVLRLMQSEGCLQKSNAVNAVIAQLQAKGGCSVTQEGKPYRYLIEEAGYFPCWVTYIDGKKFATQQRRLTLILQKEDVDVVLQLIYLQKGPVAACAGEEKKVSLGLMTWRYIRV